MKNIFKLLKSKVNLPGRIGSCFTDIRHKPQIPVTPIITSIFLMPIVGLRSFLALDNKSRQTHSKNYSDQNGRCSARIPPLNGYFGGSRTLKSRKWALGFPDLFEEYDLENQAHTKGQELSIWHHRRLFYGGTLGLCS